MYLVGFVLMYTIVTYVKIVEKYFNVEIEIPSMNIILIYEFIFN